MQSEKTTANNYRSDLVKGFQDLSDQAFVNKNIFTTTVNPLIGATTYTAESLGIK